MIGYSGNPLGRVDDLDPFGAFRKMTVKVPLSGDLRHPSDSQINAARGEMDCHQSPLELASHSYHGIEKLANRIPVLRGSGGSTGSSA